MNKTKKEFLEKEGIINPKPERVSYSLFKNLEFFDSLDLPQVKYEMLRTARVDKVSVSDVCKLFGFSREYFYKLERAFMERGYVSLLGTTMGRRPLIAINQEIVNYIAHRKLNDSTISGESLRKEILSVYKVDCSRRTVERIIEKIGFGKKKL